LSSSLLSFDLKNIRLSRWLTRGAPAEGGGPGLKVKYPPVAMEMEASQLSLARLARDKQKRWHLTSHELVEVPPEVIESEVFRVRVKSPDRLRDIVAGAIQKEGVKTTGISLVLPDHVARVALLPFEELPRTRREIIEMVRWKMKKAVPFKVEEASVDYQAMPGTAENPEKGFTLLAVLIPTLIVEEHEAAFTRQGIHPGLVDLSSFCLAQLYRSVIEKDVSAGGDYMMLNITGACFTVMIFRAGRLIFYRCKTFALGGEENGNGGGDRLVRREIQSSLLYYQERLAGKGLERVYMRLVGPDPEKTAEMFGGGPVHARPEPIDLGRVVGVSGRIAALGPDRSWQVTQRLAPAVGAVVGRES